MGCESCTESCEDACPCIGGFPQLWALFTLLLTGGVALGAASLYGLISLYSSILKFKWAGSYNVFINSSAAGTAAGIAMLVLALFTWCAFRSQGFALAFKIIFGTLLVACVGAALLATVGSLKVYTGLANQRSDFSQAFDDAWMGEIRRNGSTVICDVQKRLQCYGFSPGDCTETRGGQIRRCDTRCQAPPKPEDARGCRFTIADFYRQWSLPVAITSIFAVLCCLIALGILIATVSFSLDVQKGDA